MLDSGSGFQYTSLTLAAPISQPARQDALAYSVEIVYVGVEEGMLETCVARLVIDKLKLDIGIGCGCQRAVHRREDFANREKTA